MKEKDAIVDYKPHELVVFAEKEDGSIGGVRTGSFMSKNYIDRFWDNMRQFEASALEQLRAGAISPVGFYMQVREMAPADVASRVGLGTARVKKHMQPKHFGDMTIAVAARYAEVFGIPVANLFQIIPMASAGAIRQTGIGGSFVVVTETQGDAH